MGKTPLLWGFPVSIPVKPIRWCKKSVPGNACRATILPCHWWESKSLCSGVPCQLVPRGCSHYVGIGLIVVNRVWVKRFSMSHAFIFLKNWKHVECRMGLFKWKQCQLARPSALFAVLSPAPKVASQVGNGDDPGRYLFSWPKFGGFRKWGTPKWMMKITEHSIKMDEKWRYPHSMKTPCI